MVEMKCEQCGFENKDNAKFCTKCGKPLVQKVAPAVPKESNNIKYIVPKNITVEELVGRENCKMLSIIDESLANAIVKEIEC